MNYDPRSLEKDKTSMKNLLDKLNSLFTFTRRKEVEIPHPYAYVIVRTDIPLHQQLVQAAHAAHYAGFRTKEPDEICSLITLQVANEWELFQAFRHLAMNQINVIPFFEPDWDMGLSAIATEPLYTKAQRQPLREKDEFGNNKYELWTAPDALPTGLTPEDLTEGPKTPAALQNPLYRGNPARVAR